jgi:hypothetical protein
MRGKERDCLPAGSAELLLRELAGAIPMLYRHLLAKNEAHRRILHTLDIREDVRVPLSTGDLPFASTFNITDVVDEGKRIRVLQRL